MLTGAVLAHEMGDVEEAVALVLSKPLTRQITTQPSFERHARGTVRTHYPEHSQEFRDWVAANAWRRHEDERVRLELSLPELFALRDAALVKPEQNAALLSTITKMTGMLVSKGFEQSMPESGSRG